MAQLRDVSVLKIDGVVRLVVAPEEIHEDESDEECEEGQRGLKDSLRFAFTVHGSHALYGNAGEVRQAGCERAEVWE